MQAISSETQQKKINKKAIDTYMQKNITENKL